ncbi:MAG: exodeoxyribonuclease III [Candidatus Thiodiazotropha taylori]|nr:exodeoxyribonuclease III [Candidatus Thiodiazotropha taylori]MCG7944070.1 exodeoxyribonuclease III [Candidatus Thiodiazotropha taylori]MCG7959399.1 exodeoxyribonuclease III [Candidatus Thiodiazotropha taylori]MCG8090506.1 exodeoxyribonuclease III [Candidatus Thiodiazotropha taylori]MCW4232963.1 exodeoxyribonuclease III [Candidatus Thiodiazotropha taylori]
MKIVSFNTNGIRAREHQLTQLKAEYDPDVIGIQESKVQDADFPHGMIDALDYQAAYHGQKTHYGVALLSKSAPLEVSKGFPGDEEDAQRRMIIGRYQSPKGQDFTLLNGYFPQGESRDHEVKFPAKRKFYADLLDYLNNQHDPSEPLMVIGDMNVAPLDLDIGIGPDNAKRWLKTGKCSFLPEEREWLQALLDWGLVDSYRQLKPEVDDRFSWFDYRSRGFDRDPKRGLRIDLMLVTQPLMDCCTDVGIAYDIRGMEKPSDHCPVWAEFDF